MSTKPSYIGTLNAIANGERQGSQVLNCLSEVCDPAVRSLIKTVALREAEHAAVFEKRLCELGFELREKTSADLPKTLEMIQSGMSDLEKFKKLGYDKLKLEDEDDRLLGLLADRSIDPLTAGLLGRFIAEERDSLRLLQSAWECVSCESECDSSDDQVKQLTNQVKRLTSEVAALKSIVEGAGKKSRKSKVHAVKI